MPKAPFIQQSKNMKRLSNIYKHIISTDNLLLAHKNACKGKRKQHGVIRFKRNLSTNIEALHEQLKLGEYKSPTYKTFTIYEPKERTISVIPYRDRIVQHAIMQKLSGMFVKNFTKDTYSSIKNRGLHKASRNIKKALSIDGNDYALKIDIKKFYPSINKEILKSLLLRKIKDKEVLSLLFIIIDGHELGLPLGNYLSQYLANYYLSGFDHWLKEEKKVKHYFRYCDDGLFISDSKEELHLLLIDIKEYLWDNLKLEVKGNHQVYPVHKRGIDFLGFVFWKGEYGVYILLRKLIKQRFARQLIKGASRETIASYMGWLKWCNSINLKRKLLGDYQYEKATSTPTSTTLHL